MSMSLSNSSNNDHKSLYVTFNKTFKNFIKELIATYPEVTELKTMLLMYKIAKTMSYKRPQRLFNTSVAQKHADDIINCRIDNILNESFTELDIDAGYINKVKEKFRALVDEDHKVVIQKHLLCLLLLNNKCLEVASSSFTLQHENK